MGGAASSSTHDSGVDDEGGLSEDSIIGYLVSDHSISTYDAFWEDELDDVDLMAITLDPFEVSYVLDTYAIRMIENCRHSKNYRNMLIVLCCALEDLHAQVRNTNETVRVMNETVHVLPAEATLLNDGAGHDDDDDDDYDDDDDGRRRRRREHRVLVPDWLYTLMYLTKCFTKAFIEMVPLDELHTYFTFDDYHELDTTPQPEPTPHIIHAATTGSTEQEAPATESPRPKARYFLRSGRELPHRLMQALVNVTVDLKLTADTYGVHIEVLNTLLVFLSSQVHPDAGSNFHNPFLHALLQGPVRRRAPELIQTLLVNYMQRLPSQYEVSSAKYRALPPGVLTRARDSLWSLITLPVRFIRHLFDEDDQRHPLSDRSILLFLVIMHQRMVAMTDTGFYRLARTENVYVRCLQALADTDTMLTTSSSTAAAAVAVAVAAGTGPANVGLKPLSTMDDTVPSTSASSSLPPVAYSPATKLYRLSFPKLYNTLAVCLADDQEWAYFLLYTLLYGNGAFGEHLYSRTDLDDLVMPLLHGLYRQKESDFQSNQAYLIIITLLMFSQDGAFAQTVNRGQPVAHVEWFKEQALTDITVGSLVMVVLLRTISHNLGKVRDPYLHTNCLATLANMATHTTHIHPYAARSLVNLFQALSRRFVRLQLKKPAPPPPPPPPPAAAPAAVAPPPPITSAVDIQLKHVPDNPFVSSSSSSTTTIAAPTGSPEDEQQQQQEDSSNVVDLSTITGFMRIVLEILRSCLGPKNTCDNAHLIYWLVHTRALLDPFQAHPQLADIVQPLVHTVNHFSEQVRHAQTASGTAPLSVDAVLEVIANSAKVWSSNSGSVGGDDGGNDATNHAKYKYEQEEHAEEFFLPYIWSIVINVPGIRESVATDIRLHGDGGGDGDMNATIYHFPDDDDKDNSEDADDEDNKNNNNTAENMV